jgi:hypothetical protein
MIWKCAMCNKNICKGRTWKFRTWRPHFGSPNKPSTSLLDSVGQDVGVGLEEALSDDSILGLAGALTILKRCY